jgi:hypothetical protein
MTYLQQDPLYDVPARTLSCKKVERIFICSRSMPPVAGVIKPQNKTLVVANEGFILWFEVERSVKPFP